MMIPEASLSLSIVVTGMKIKAITIRSAITDGRLRANLVRGPVLYYKVIEDDLIEWVSDPNMHKSGRKTE